MDERVPIKFGTIGGSLSDGFTTIDSSAAETQSIEEGTNAEQEALDYQGVVAYVKERFERAKDARFQDEERWLRCYKNYRGLGSNDNPDPFTKTEKSKVFIKASKTKAIAAIAQVSDVLYAGNKFPLGAEPTPIPEGIAESVHFDPKNPENQMPPEQQGRIPTTRGDITEMLGNLSKKLEPVKDKLEEGPGKSPSALTWSPAHEAAKRTEKKFQDMLEEANAKKSLDRTIFDLSIYGTGVFKGPMAKIKDTPKWDEQGNYTSEQKTIADFAHVSIWDSYPDPEARIPEEMAYFIQRHKMNKSALRALKKRPHFREESIELAITTGPNYTKEYWENTLEDNGNEVTPETFEVLEFWGVIDKDIAEIAELEIPDQYKDLDEVQVNIWTCNGYPLRIVFNPFVPARIPYFLVPYEIHPYSIFGIGVVENMEDTQTLMNGFMRMAVDNAALSGNNIFEVNSTLLSPGQDMEIYPGKIIYTEGQLGQAIRDIKFNNVTNENFLLFDKARQLADEATGIPSYSHGQTGVQSMTRTASGMSMLMGASALNIKNVVRNIDEYLLVPLGKAMYSYLMQFEPSKEYIGDFDIVARGTQSLMRNEIRSQKILQALQVTANPMDAPFVKRDYLLRELMDCMDIDSDKAVNDPREAALQAEIMKELQMKMGIDPSKQQQGQNPTGAPNASDPTQTGGGNVAPGAAPEPGAPGFTGKGGGNNGGQPQKPQQGQPRQ